MKKILLTMLVLTAAVILSANSFAATTGTTLDVSLSAVVSCTVQTTPVVFDGYDGSVDVTGFGDVTVTCPEGIIYEIALDAGQHYDGLYRHMADSALNLIAYVLYNPIGDVEWGDVEYASTFPDGFVWANVGDNTPQSNTVNGFVFGGQSVLSEPYIDVVNVTVYY